MILRTLTVYLFALTLILLHPIALADDDTDVVIFDNGDRLTGEFKSMQRGKVTLKSFGASTIDLHWERISNVSIERTILVETVLGTRYSGAISPSDDAGQIIVATTQGPIPIDNDQIVSMFPIDGDGFKDLKINVSAGYNFAKANAVTQANLGADVTQRTTKHIAKASYSGNASNSSNSENSQRRLLGISYSRLRPNRWLTSGLVSLDTNDELNIDLRTSIGAGGGRILAESDHSFFSLQAGLLLTRESLTDVPDDTKSVESFVDLQWDWYKFAEPDLDWSSRLKLIPSLTESGRIRGELDASLSWKIIGDLRWQLEFYSSYDNKPQTTDAESIDYGVNTSVAYKF